MLEANYLTILLAPNYEKPVDTAQDILARGLRVIFSPGMESTVDTSKNSPYKTIRDLAEVTDVAEVIFRYFKTILIFIFP